MQHCDKNDRALPASPSDDAPRSTAAACADFHDGPHSNESSSGKRARRCDAPASSKAALDSRGQAGYGGLCKTGHREAFVYSCLATRGPVAYLEGPDGALTSLLLARGVAPDRLEPFNLSAAVARSVEAKFPGVQCRVQDICEAAAAAGEEYFSAMWLDMCGGDFGSYEVCDLVHAAEYKFFTLSCRQVICSDKQAALCSRLCEAGEKVMERALYTGCSGRAMNMVFVVSKRSRCGKRASSDESGAESAKTMAVGTVVRFPLSHWKSSDFVSAYGFKVFEGEFLMGAVHSQTSSGSYRLSFQVEGGGSMLCALRYSRACVASYAM